MRILIIILLAIFTLMPISASFGSDDTVAENLAGNEAEPMPASIARVRIQQAMDHATPFEDRHSILSEVVARCEDHQLRSIASYNMGIAYIRRQPTDPGSLADAVEWLRQADTEGTSSELRVRARDSIGHAWYLMARADQENQDTALNPTDLPAMKEQLVDELEQLIVSASAFRAAHDVDHSYRPAIENLERVRQEIQNIRNQINSLEELIEQQQDQAQQRQQQQQQQQETAERLEELAEKQQQEANENSEQSSKTPEEQSQQAEDQDELCNQTQSEQEGLSEQQDDSEAMQEVEQQMQSARDAQERAQDALSQGNMQEAAKAQEEAADALESAANKLREMSENGTEGKNGGEPEPEQESDGEEQEPEQSQGDDAEEAPQEISEIAQQLLDKERRERERRKARRTPRVVPVERDW